MNYITHLTGFFERVSKDDRLNPSHVSLYMALFQYWNMNRFENPISIARNEIMRVSKIGATATYHKNIKDLHNYGYLHYKPSFNPFKGSLVNMFNFSSGSKQAVNNYHTKSETAIKHALVPSLNSINITNNKTYLNGKAQKNSGKEISIPPQVTTSVKKANEDSEAQQLTNQIELQKSCAKKVSNFVCPELPEIQEYFASQNFPVIEGEKFFNHFSSTGWLIGGKSKMKNWQAASRNWMLNASQYIFENGTYHPKHKSHKAGNLYTGTNKDYSEPL